MRVFMTGATGFIGSAIVPTLLNAKHQVLGLARSHASADALRHAGCDVLKGDLRDLGSLRRGAEQADAVIYTAFDHDFSRMAENCEMDRVAIETMGSALAGSGKRFIVTSGLPPLMGRVSTETDILPAGAHGMPRVSEQVAMALADSGVSVSVIRMPQVRATPANTRFSRRTRNRPLPKTAPPGPARSSCRRVIPPYRLDCRLARPNWRLRQLATH